MYKNKVFQTASKQLLYTLVLMLPDLKQIHSTRTRNELGSFSPDDVFDVKNMNLSKSWLRFKFNTNTLVHPKIRSCAKCFAKMATWKLRHRKSVAFLKTIVLRTCIKVAFWRIIFWEKLLTYSLLWICNTLKKMEYHFIWVITGWSDIHLARQTISSYS